MRHNNLLRDVAKVPKTRTVGTPPGDCSGIDCPTPIVADLDKGAQGVRV